MTSFSQFGEDAVVNALLHRNRKGFYVDVGAFHPTLYSNTYAFYTREWSGIAIDPSERAQKLFRIFRQRDTFLRVGVGREEAARPYIQFDDPAYNTMNVEQGEIWKKEGRRVVREGRVSVLPLNTILHTHNVTSIDLLSIDVEGLDRVVLESHDWTIPTKAIIVEDHTFDSEQPTASDTYRFLKEKGYTLKGICGPSLIFMYDHK